MWIHVYMFHAIFILNYLWYGVESKQRNNLKNSNEIKERTFLDVLKNITTANKILQELINNYEELQKIYNTNEERSRSRSDVGDDDSLSKQISASNEDNVVTEKNIHQSHGITQMIYEVVSKENQTDIDPVRNDSNIFVSQSVEVTGTKYNDSDGKMSMDKSSNEIEIITKKMNYTIVEKKPGHRERKLSRINKTKTKMKTRFSIKNKESRRDVKGSFSESIEPPIQDTFNNDSGKVKRIVYAEIFSPDKLWQEVVSKPLDLRIYNDEKINFKASDADRKANDIESSEPSSNSKPDDDVIRKEELKSHLLRNAYGDACLQVAVRKCYKALKAVCKTVCRLHSKCKSSLKSSFKENSKTGCIREFANNNRSVDGIEINFERRSRGDTTVSKYVDLCLPALGPNTKTKQDTRSPQMNTKDNKDIYILRDRFEKACRKLSATKCMKACKFARDAACSTHNCGSRKKSFAKACKRECKSAYNLVKESSDSDDDDDSDSGSD